MAKAHGGLIVVHGVVHTAHQALIITEEENTERGNAVDGNEQAPLLVLVYHIGAGDGVHVRRRSRVECRRGTTDRPMTWKEGDNKRKESFPTEAQGEKQ